VALQKRVTNAVATSGVHVLTLSDVDGLEIGYSIRVAGVGQTFDGQHSIAALNTTT
jgi:hypothetical protein